MNFVTDTVCSFHEPVVLLLRFLGILSTLQPPRRGIVERRDKWEGFLTMREKNSFIVAGIRSLLELQPYFSCNCELISDL